MDNKQQEKQGVIEALKVSEKRYRRLFESAQDGYPFDVIARKGLLDGREKFIQKPFSKNALASKVREALEQDVSVKAECLGEEKTQSGVRQKSG